MAAKKEKIPGVIIAGLNGGAGKTLISLGITAAWKSENIRVAPFKKGPDYIDAGWLSMAADRPCYNLDTFLCEQVMVKDSYLNHSKGSDIAVIEGNRGLFDGIDTHGQTSSAELAKLLDLPVLLILDCSKSTRTVAAQLLGCMHFDPAINICGVILNRVAGKRHEQKVRESIKQFCHIPVFGALPKLAPDDFPERHMGLVPSDEHTCSNQAIKSATSAVKTYVDLDRLLETLTASCRTRPETVSIVQEPQGTAEETVTIGVVRDAAFQFYYPDNLEALENLGAKIRFISPLVQTAIPEVDAIYIGGGFPETHALELAGNHSFRNQLKSLSQKGLPIYAECGGLMYLGKSIELEGRVYPMSGILPIRFGLSKKPQAHGYTKIRVARSNPFFSKCQQIRGHEFRYSTVLSIDYKEAEMAFSMERGKGIVEGMDGFFKDSTFGTYTHIHALGTLSWALSMVFAARKYKRQSQDCSHDLLYEYG